MLLIFTILIIYRPKKYSVLALLTYFDIDTCERNTFFKTRIRKTVV